MHTGFTVPGFKDIAHIFPNGSNHYRATLHVKSAHPANVTGQVTFGDKFRKSRLFDQRRSTVKNPSSGNKRVKQVFGHNQIAQPKSGKKNLAECADVNHTAIAVQPLKSRNWFATVTVLTVEIIFENPRVISRRPVKKLEPVCKAQDNAERKLMRWRNINQLGSALLPGEETNSQPISPHADWNDL